MGDTFNGETLALLATAAAIRLSQGRSGEELGVLAAFFTTLGDQLSLIAAQRTLNPGVMPDKGDVKSS